MTMKPLFGFIIFKVIKMKKIFILTCVFSFLIFYSQKINFKSDTQIIYSLVFKPDSTQNKTTDNIVTLYLNGNQSIFQDDKKAKIDSIIASQKFTQLSSLPLFKTNHVIYKDLKKSLITYSEVIDYVNFGYNESIKDLKWKLYKGKKIILNYSCQEAKINFYGRNYTAWYTPELPVNDGPYKFSGLPGLIMEIYDDDDNFHYSAIAITKKTVDILYDTNFNIIERKKLRDSKINNIIKHSKTEIKLNPMERK